MSIVNVEHMNIVLDDGAYAPVREHQWDAGLDLRTPYAFEMGGSTAAIINTLVHVEIPHGFYGRIESKSGLNLKHSIVSCGGTIDEGYTGSIRVKLYNLGTEPYEFTAGDKIAQLVICPCIHPELTLVKALNPTDRGDNGFGSTGK